MKQLLVLSVLLAAFCLAGAVPARAHCEIPCGIYGDNMRVALLFEDIATIEKSMNQIVALSKDPAANANQLARWIDNKEEHCDKIQRIVTQYFMTQRVKPAPDSDIEGRKRYVGQLSALHGMLIHAMKAKQTTDLKQVEQLRLLVEEFAGLYFGEEELEHLRKEHR